MSRLTILILIPILAFTLLGCDKVIIEKTFDDGFRQCIPSTIITKKEAIFVGYATNYQILDLLSQHRGIFYDSSINKRYDRSTMFDKTDYDVGNGLVNMNTVVTDCSFEAKSDWNLSPEIALEIVGMPIKGNLKADFNKGKVSKITVGECDMYSCTQGPMLEKIFKAPVSNPYKANLYNDDDTFIITKVITLKDFGVEITYSDEDSAELSIKAPIDVVNIDGGLAYKWVSKNTLQVTVADERQAALVATRYKDIKDLENLYAGISAGGDKGTKAIMGSGTTKPLDIQSILERASTENAAGVLAGSEM